MHYAVIISVGLKEQKNSELSLGCSNVCSVVGNILCLKSLKSHQSRSSLNVDWSLMRSMNSAGTLLAKIVNVLLFPIYPVAQGFWNITANVFCILLLSHKIYGQRETVEPVWAKLVCILCNLCTIQIFFKSMVSKQSKGYAEQRGKWK